MRVLRTGSKGPEVRRWQAFLRGQDFDKVIVDGVFGKATRTATVDFQRQNGLEPDGVVGSRTYGKAMGRGFDPVADDDESPSGPNWPRPPGFPPLSTNEERQQLFGPLEYVPAPRPNNPEGIRVTNGWDRTKLKTFPIPQLVGVVGAAHDGKATFHIKAKGPILALFAAWEKAGLLDLVLTWAGSYAPRFVRGASAERVLSNHAFGTAFDINVAWNRLGTQPALKGSRGSVRELVPLANEHGFFWGGHFRDRPDGMHFELARLD